MDLDPVRRVLTAALFNVAGTIAAMAEEIDPPRRAKVKKPVTKASPPTSEWSEPPWYGRVPWR